MRHTNTKLAEIENRNFQSAGSAEHELIVTLEYLDYLKEKGYNLVKLMAILEYVVDGDLDSAKDIKNQIHDSIQRLLLDPANDGDKIEMANSVDNYRLLLELFDLIELAQDQQRSELLRKHKEER